MTINSISRTAAKTASARSLLAGTALLLALSACQPSSSGLESLPPEQAGAVLGAEDAYGATDSVPSEFSDADGEMGL